MIHSIVEGRHCKIIKVGCYPFPAQMLPFNETTASLNTWLLSGDGARAEKERETEGGSRAFILLGQRLCGHVAKLWLGGD